MKRDILVEIISGLHNANYEVVTIVTDMGSTNVAV